MKKIILILMLILGILFAQLDNVSDAELSENVENLKIVVRGIQDGFLPWIRSNWYFFLLSLVGVGQVIVKITPTEKDNVWYDKYIIGPFRKLGKVLSLGGKK